MNNVVVVDTSIALKWVLSEVDSDIALALVIEWTKKKVDIIAPALLIYEATNILYRDARADKIAFDTAKNGIDVILERVALEFLQEPTLSIRAMEFAHKFGLPASYDTHFLALAERKGCELWTADTRMYKAVKGQIDWVHSISDYQMS